MEIMQIYVTDEDRAHEVEQKLAQGDDFASVANNYNEDVYKRQDDTGVCGICKRVCVGEE